MATENPLRFMGSTGAGQWSSSENAASFSFNDMEAEELGLLMKGYKIHEDQKDVAPNRSSSAPPNMEGSFAAVGNIMAQQNPGLSQSLASLSSSFENYESEEQLRADPAYFAYYCSNVNLNPRLPPPLLSRENRRLTRHSGGFGNNWRLTSFDDNINGPLHLTHGSLSTHEEELEEEKSSQKASDDWAVSGSMLLSPPGKSASSATRHKSSIDVMQGGFPHPPSPVCSQSRSSTYATTEESVDHDIEATALNDSSGGRSNLAKPNHGSGEVGVSADTLNADVVASIPNNDAPDASFPSLSFSDGIGSLQAPQRGKPTNKDAGSENNALTGGATESNFSRMESRMRALNASSLLGDNGRNKQEQSYDRIIPQRHPNQQETATMYKVQGVQTQLISQGLNSSYGGIDKLSHFLPKVPSVEAQQVPPELTPPLYATAAAYMTAGSPFYPNLHASGLFPPQFNMSGYALGSTLFPPFMAGYPSQNPIPMPFDASSTHNFNGRTAGVSTGEHIPHGGDYPYLNKIYGQHGLMLQPSFMDPHHMQYFQPYLEVGYSASGQYGRLTSRSDAGGQIGSFVLQKDSPYRNGPNLQSPSSGSLSNPSPRKGATKGGSYYGSPPSLGVATQFPAPALASPVLPGSPVGGSSHPEQRHEMRFPQGSVRNTGVYAGRQGQRRGESFDDPKKHTFLEELKANNARKFELSDIAGRIVEFSVDQYGSRFIQQKLENCGAEDKASVFKEVLPHASKLMTDVFGNYVIQKFFEHGSHEQRKELANQLSGQMLSLSLQMCGCRVIQKALEVIELDQKTQLVHELDGHVMRCVRDQNGNHVIQKCIECVPTEKIGFIIDAFRGHVATLSTHPYGCRVIQRVLEHCSDQLQSQCIVDEILESACVLAQDQYGNYVTQHVLDRGRPYERSCIISELSGKIVQMSQHKYASNVVEKCLEHGDASERELLIQEIIGQSEENDNLLIMMKDQFANYVVQKILETSNDKQREVLLKRVRGHLNALKKYTYGKHIVARFEQIYGEETEASDHP